MGCRTVRIGDVASFRKESIKPVAGVTYRCYSLPAFDNAKTPETLDGSEILSNKLRIEAGDILVNKLNMRFKRIWPVDKLLPNSVCSTEFVPLCPKGNIDRNYLLYILLSDDFTRQLSGMRTGTSGSHQRVKPEWILDYHFELPDETLQHRIGGILSSIDAKVAANSKLNGYLAELIDALFCELVLGALDLSNTVQFSSVLSERKEKCLSRTNPEYSVTDTGIHPRDSKFHKNLSAATSKNKILRKDDLVFGISRKILNWGLFEDEIGEVSSAYRVYSIRSLPPEYVARYIAHYQHAFTDIIKPSSREGQGIMPDALMAKTIPVLDEEAWSRYVQAVESIKEQIRIVADESDALAELRDTLLPKLMFGEIDVSKVDLTQLNSHLA